MNKNRDEKDRSDIFDFIFREVELLDELAINGLIRGDDNYYVQAMYEICMMFETEDFSQKFLEENLLRVLTLARKHNQELRDFEDKKQQNYRSNQLKKE